MIKKNSEISNEEAVKKLREDKISRDATHAERLKWEAELTKQLEILRRDLSARLQKVKHSKILLNRLTIKNSGARTCY